MFSILTNLVPIELDPTQTHYVLALQRCLFLNSYKRGVEKVGP